MPVDQLSEFYSLSSFVLLSTITEKDELLELLLFI